jgi:YcxB-like protein
MPAMQISMAVPYDEQRLRRTLRFILRPQLRTVRILGAALAVIGLGTVALDPAEPMSYVPLAVGLLFVFLLPPYTTARSLRMQSNVIRDGCHITLDDEWATITYPLVESRFRWAGLNRVIETPEAWYAMFGKLQAVTIPKDPMTETQRAEFAAFVDRLQPASNAPAHKR